MNGPRHYFGLYDQFNFLQTEVQRETTGIVIIKEHFSNFITTGQLQDHHLPLDLLEAVGD